MSALLRLQQLIQHGFSRIGPDPSDGTVDQAAHADALRRLLRLSTSWESTSHISLFEAKSLVDSCLDFAARGIDCGPQVGSVTRLFSYELARNAVFAPAATGALVAHDPLSRGQLLRSVINDLWSRYIEHGLVDPNGRVDYLPGMAPILPLELASILRAPEVVRLLLKSGAEQDDVKGASWTRYPDVLGTYGVFSKNDPESLGRIQDHTEFVEALRDDNIDLGLIRAIAYRHKMECHVRVLRQEIEAAKAAIDEVRGATRLEPGQATRARSTA